MWRGGGGGGEGGGGGGRVMEWRGGIYWGRGGGVSYDSTASFLALFHFDFKIAPDYSKIIIPSPESSLTARLAAPREPTTKGHIGTIMTLLYHTSIPR